MILSRVLVGNPYVGDKKGVQPGYQIKMENPTSDGKSKFYLVDKVEQILPIFQFVFNGRYVDSFID